MKIKISEIKENPFRKELGPYNEEQIARITESYQMSDFGSNNRFEVRKNDNHYELVYGHHRLLALKRYYGNDLEVEIIIRNYRDVQMLRELLRENLIKSDDWHLKMLSLALIKKYWYLFRDENPNIKDILYFISKDGKIMHKEEARILLKIYENLAPELLEKTKKMESIYAKYEDKDFINLTQAKALSDFNDKQEQLDLAKALKNSIIQNTSEQIKLLNRYKIAAKELRTKIRSGEADLISLKDSEINTKEDRSRSYDQTEKIKTMLSANKQALYIYSCLSDAIKNIEKLNKKKLDLKTKLSLEKIYRKTIAVLTAETREVIDV